MALSISLPSGMPLDDFFASVPVAFRSVLKSGFVAMGKLSPGQQDELLRLSSESLHEGSSASSAEVASRLGLNDEQAAGCLAAAMTMILSISTEDKSPDDFVAAVTKAGLLGSEAVTPVLTLAKRVEAARGTLKASARRSKLANQLLPSLDSLETSLDMRLSFNGDQVDLAVPVALIHISTDAAHEELWFQMNKSQLEKAIGDLQMLLKRMGQSEELVKDWSSSKR